MFSKYETWNSRLNLLKAEYDYLNEHSIKSAKLDREVSGGCKPTLVDTIQKKDNVEIEINELENKLNIFLKSLDVLDSEERYILFSLYGRNAKYNKASAIADKLYISRRSLFYKKDKALKRILELLNG